MLVLSREVNHALVLGETGRLQVLTVVKIRRDKVWLTLADLRSSAPSASSSAVPAILEKGEVLKAEPGITIEVVDIRPDKVRLGISAPRHCEIHRREVWEAFNRENRATGGENDDGISPSPDPSKPKPGADSGSAACQPPDAPFT
jgi:carbon storage regulator